MSATTIGLIGLGNIGQAMLGPLGRAGIAVVGCDIAPERQAQARAQGAAIAADPAAVARAADLVLFSLPRAETSRAVMAALLPAARPGLLVVETSTVLPSDMEALAAIAAPAGIRLAEAAVAGGVADLARGQTTFLAAGEAPDLDRAEPVLGAMAREVLRLGPRGAGMGAKVIINAVYHAEMVVLVEAAALARRIGLPLLHLHDLLARPNGIMRPLAHRLRERIMAGDYQGGMSTRNARKDSELVLKMGLDLGVPLPLMNATHPVYEMGVAAGHGELDYAALAKLWEGFIGASLAEGPPGEKKG